MRAAEARSGPVSLAPRPRPHLNRQPTASPRAVSPATGRGGADLRTSGPPHWTFAPPHRRPVVPLPSYHSTQCSTLRTMDQRCCRGAASCPRIQCLYAASSVPSLRFKAIQVLTKLANRSSRLPMGNASGARIGLGPGTTTEYCGNMRVHADPRSAGSHTASTFGSVMGSSGSSRG